MGNTRKPGSAEHREAITPVSSTRAFLAARLPPGSRLCLGLSGGLDSTVLLHVLAGLRDELQFSLHAVHVHHGLSPNADAWAEHCRRICRDWQVPLTIEPVTVVSAGKGIEDAARQARYAIFTGIDSDAVLLAHHLDDQVETFFMRALRGAGVNGLASMAEDIVWRGRRILRPLLGLTRADLEAYAHRHGLEAVLDESNLDTRLTRNFLRHDCLPAVESRFPAYRRSVARAMAHLGEAQDLLRLLAVEDAARCADFGHPECAQLAGLGAARGKNLLRHWLAETLQRLPGSAQLEALWQQVVSVHAESALHWRVDGGEVRAYRGRLYALRLPEPDWPEEVVWQGESSLDWGRLGRLTFTPALGEGLAARCLAAGTCRLQSRVTGGHFRPDQLRPAKPLGKWFQERGVPPWERAALPRLLIADALVWVAGLGVDCRYQALGDEPGWLISWQPHP